MFTRFSTILIFFLLHFSLQSQVSFTANDSVFHYQGQFRVGYNSGFAAGWSDLSIATLAAGDLDKFVIGVGMRSNRDALFFEALETQGYTSKMEEVVHYDSLGLKDLTALVLGGENGFLPEPPAPYRDTAHYCPTKQSTLFANLYEPIWDDGSDGTPYNDNNYFAAYMYKTVNQYKDFVTYWEIWNEPGFDYSGNRGWRMQGDTVGNWWDNDPDPCDYKLGAPVQHYVRTLRIAWEIVKTLDPESFVCMGAAGFPSFVDAVSRNTDNPNGGSVTLDYPLKGGAYFDAMIYHSFPHIDGGFVVSEDPYQIVRNSDVAANYVIKQRNNYEKVLESYGYNGQQYPRKQFLITEINLPRKIFNYGPKTYGGQVAQRNFMMKALLNCKINNILQAHVYTFGELRTEAEATDEFDLMGLFKNMDNTNYYTALPTDAGVGLKTMLPLIWDTEYDAQRSAALNNNPDVRIEAFKRKDGTYLYVLWAIMKQDFNEYGTGKYSFPSSVTVPIYLKKLLWTNSISAETFIATKNDISVDGTPTFLMEDNLQGLALPSFTLLPASGCIPFSVQYTNTSLNADSIRWHFPNGTPEFSTAQNPSVTYADKGFHTVSLTAYKGQAAQTNNQDYFIHARGLPVPGFDEFINFGNAFFLNTTFDADSVVWSFGDGSANSKDFYPAHTYKKNGKYEVSLTATNPCGTVVYRDSIEILYALEVDFVATQTTGCAPFTVQFQPISPLATKYQWFFPDSDIDTSGAAMPLVTYAIPGIYPVSLTVSNGASSGTLTKTAYITVLDAPSANFSYQVANLSVVFTNNSANALSYLWKFGDGTTSILKNPSHIFSASGDYDVRLLASSACGVDTILTTVRVYAQPKASFTQTITTGCAPMAVQFQNTGTTGFGASYYWEFPGGQPATSFEENPLIQYNQAGIFPVRFKITNPVGKDSVQIAQGVQVKTKAKASFTSSSNLDTVCLTLTSMVGVDSLLWNFGDGFTSKNPSPCHSYGLDSNALVSVSLVVYSACGSDTLVENIALTIIQPVAIFSANVQSGCEPLNVQFSAINSIADSVRWEFQGGTPALSNALEPLVTYANDGLFNVRLIAFTAAGNDTLFRTAYIDVLPKPESFFGFVIVNDTVSFQNQSIPVDGTFTWMFGDGLSSQLFEPSHIYAPGNYSVSLTVESECGTDNYHETVVILTSQKTAIDGSIYTLFPNPSSGVFYLRNENNNILEYLDIQVFSAVGQSVFKQKNYSTQTSLDLLDLPDGFYLLRARNSKGLLFSFNLVKI